MSRYSASASSRPVSSPIARDHRYSTVSLSLPVPWGHIAGKAWGDPSGRRVLALHGWLDNAASFDKLIPLLSDDLYVVAIDLPGHGLSSHKPRGTICSYDDYFTNIKYVLDALDWDHFMILGHSFGGTLSLLLAAALPSRVDAVVTIEGVGELSEIPASILPTLMRGILNGFFRPVKERAVYSWDAVVNRIQRGHSSIDPHTDRETAETLAHRGAKPVEGGFMLTHDPQLTIVATAENGSLGSFCMDLSEEIYTVFFSSICCPILVIQAEHSGYEPWLIEKRISYLPRDKVQLVRLAGGHQLHMYNAAAVVKPVDTFLHNPANSKL